ncbi:MAG: hypothetical protein A2987_05605 [Omnitrophica bacterium RIFCSPLOWO2_01_FULL_45_10]|nr:MAG: hypothetical protein A2987_05605 [Omnitrophica bacterium RIFCSPLOWO2_01_FULL_45_10]
MKGKILEISAAIVAISVLFFSLAYWKNEGRWKQAEPTWQIIDRKSGDLIKFNQETGETYVFGPNLTGWARINVTSNSAIGGVKQAELEQNLNEAELERRKKEEANRLMQKLGISEQ